MGIESGVVSRLNSVTEVTDLTSNRIYADVLPDGTNKPAIVYQLISTVPYSALNADTGKLQSRIQFTLLADTKSGLIQLSDAIKTALQRYKGFADNVLIIDSKLENIFDMAYDVQTNETARIADFLIIYE